MREARIPIPHARPAIGGPARRAAVVGAAGFIGARLTSALVADGIDAAAFTRRSRFLVDTGLSYPMCRAQIVFYLASSVNPSLGEAHPERAAADHALFARLLSRLAERDPPPTVVLTSSGGTVYDERVAPPYTEMSPVRASGRYGQAKLALEQELCRYAGRIPAVILRLSNAYGPGQPTGKGQGVLAYWMRAAMEGAPLRLIGDPECARDYVYIDDVIDCMRRVESADRHHTLATRLPLTLNVGSGEPTTLTELLSVTERAVGRSLPVERMPARRLDRRTVWLAVDRARDVLGWRPRTSLEDGVRCMWRQASSAARARPERPAPTMPQPTERVNGGTSCSRRQWPAPGRA